MTFSPAGTCSAIEELVSPIRGRRSKMSTSPIFSPSTSTVPCEGKAVVAASWSSVVLPAPFGPIKIQRSSPCAVQSTLRSRTAESRLTSTPRSRSTSSDTLQHAPDGSDGAKAHPARTTTETEPPLRPNRTNATGPPQAQSAGLTRAGLTTESRLVRGRSDGVCTTEKAYIRFRSYVSPTRVPSHFKARYYACLLDYPA
jgi:hypothetical protein